MPRPSASAAIRELLEAEPQIGAAEAAERVSAALRRPVSAALVRVVRGRPEPKQARPGRQWTAGARRTVSLPAELDRALYARALTDGVSWERALERAVRSYLGAPRKTPAKSWGYKKRQKA